MWFDVINTAIAAAGLVLATAPHFKKQVARRGLGIPRKANDFNAQLASGHPLGHTLGKGKGR